MIHCSCISKCILMLFINFINPMFVYVWMVMNFISAWYPECIHHSYHHRVGDLGPFEIKPIQESKSDTFWIWLLKLAKCRPPCCGAHSGMLHLHGPTETRAVGRPSPRAQSIVAWNAWSCLPVWLSEMDGQCCLPGPFGSLRFQRSLGATAGLFLLFIFL